MNNVNVNNVKVCKIAYALYKQDWINRHTNSSMRMDTLRKYYEFLLNNKHISLEDYLQQFGYEGNIYLDYESFRERRYPKEKYICQLLNFPELIELYYQDLNLDKDDKDRDDNDEVER